LLLVDDVDARHRQISALRQIADHGVKLRSAGFIDFLGVVHLQHHLVGEPIGNDIHRAAEHQRHQHALPAAEHAADDAEQRHDGGHQHRCLDPVEH